MKSSIKWVIFTGLLAALFLIAACAPKEGAEEGAIAGQAQSGGQGYQGGGGCSTVSGGKSPESTTCQDPDGNGPTPAVCQ